MVVALIGVANVFSLLWYLNAPIYDFLEKNLADQKPAEVILIDSESRLSRSEEEAIIGKLANFGVVKTVLLRDWEYYHEHEANLGTQKSVGMRRHQYINALPISAFQSDLGKGRSVNRPVNTMLLLEPSNDVGGISRVFDARNYQRLGLDCAECYLLGKESINNGDNARAFLINYLNLPRFSAEQVLNEWVPSDVFADKLVVFDLSVASIKEVYQTNLFNKKKVSFAYYIASVLNSVLAEQKNVVLPVYAVLLSLLAVGIVLSVFLREISLNSALVFVAFAVLFLVGLNVLTLKLFDLFVPVLEYLLLISLSLLYAVKARNTLVVNDLQASNGVLELALAETNTYSDVHDTTLCADLHRFFSRAYDIRSLSVYQINKSNQTQCALTFDQDDLDDVSLDKLVAAIDGLSSRSERLDFVDESGHAHSYFLVPISRSNKAVACIAMSIGGINELAINQLINLSDKYRDELNAEVNSWLMAKDDVSTHNRLSPSSMHGRRRTLAHRNRQYVRELMERYKQAKGNYNRLDSAVAIYDVYGNIMSVNASAETFAKQYDTVWYGSPLNTLLSHLSGLNSQKAQNVINRVLMQNIAHRFTLKGAMKDHIGVLSYRHILGQQGDAQEQIRSFLSLEILDVSNIGTSARLKDSYVRDLTNQIKQDLSKLTLLVDRLSIMDEDSEKYQFLSSVIEKLNDRVRKSKEFLVDLPSIERATQYSVNLLEKLDETLKHFEQALADKSIKLVYNKPSFLSQIVLDYRSLEFVFNYLFELLLDDSMVNSVLEVSIQETMLTSGRSIYVIVKNTGYGLPQDILESEIESDKNHPLKRCKEFAELHGGHLELSTKVGEGIEFCLELPVFNKVH